MNNLSRSACLKDVNINRRVSFTDLSREDKKKIVNLLDQLTKVTEENNIFRQKNSELKDELQKKNEIVSTYCSKIVRERENFQKEIYELKSTIENLEIENVRMHKDSANVKRTLSYEIDKLKHECYQKQELQQQIEIYKNNLDVALSSIKHLQELNEKLNTNNKKKTKASQISKKEIKNRNSDILITKQRNNDAKCLKNERNYSEENLLSELFFTSNSHGNLIESLFFVNPMNII